MKHSKPNPLKAAIVGSAVLAGGAAVVALSKKENREKVKKFIKTVSRKAPEYKKTLEDVIHTGNQVKKIIKSEAKEHVPTKKQVKKVLK